MKALTQIATTSNRLGHTKDYYDKGAHNQGRCQGIHWMGAKIKFKGLKCDIAAIYSFDLIL